MTDGERLAVAICLSLTLHYFLFRPLPVADATAEPIDLSTLHVVGTSVVTALAPPIAVEAAEVAAKEPAADAADQRQRALRAYLEDVSDAIHARRLAQAGDRQLIGNAVFSLAIAPDGRFSQIRLVHSSGEMALDADARHALDAASGVVGRPKILGSEFLSLTVTVKYQLGL